MSIRSASVSASGYLAEWTASATSSSLDTSPTIELSSVAKCLATSGTEKLVPLVSRAEPVESIAVKPVRREPPEPPGAAKSGLTVEGIGVARRVYRVGAPGTVFRTPGGFTAPTLRLTMLSAGVHRPPLLAIRASNATASPGLFGHSSRSC